MTRPRHRRRSVVAWATSLAAGSLASCVVPDPSYLGPKGRTTSSSGSTSSGSGSGTDTEATDTTGAPTTSSSGTTAGPSICEPQPEPPGGPCPEICTGGCDQTTCHVQCSRSGACQGSTIQCPADWRCEIECTAASACEGATIQCPPEYGCQITCGSARACRDTIVECSDGACQAQCGNANDVCDQLDFRCGVSDSVVTCELPADVAITMNPASSCACEAQGCD